MSFQLSTGMHYQNRQHKIILPLPGSNAPLKLSIVPLELYLPGLTPVNSYCELTREDEPEFNPFKQTAHLQTIFKIEKIVEREHVVQICLNLPTTVISKQTNGN
jgi:hypothetical protein